MDIAPEIEGNNIVSLDGVEIESLEYSKTICPGAIRNLVEDVECGINAGWLKCRCRLVFSL